MPTAYYEHTTPYLKKTFPQYDGPDDFTIDEEGPNDIIDNNNLDYDDDLNLDINNFDDLFDNDTDIGDFVEAYNPNVVVI